MVWPASQQTLSNGLRRVNNVALQAKRMAQEVHDDSLAGDIVRSRLVGLMDTLSQAVFSWNQVKALPGIVAYTQEQYDNSMDVITEFTAMVDLATDLRQWIFDNFPMDSGSGALLSHTLSVTGQLSPLTFTTVQLAEFRTKAQSFIASIG